MLNHPEGCICGQDGYPLNATTCPVHGYEVRKTITTNHVQWCTRCGARFTEAEIEGETCCPECGDAGVPCDCKNDVTVKIN